MNTQDRAAVVDIYKTDLERHLFAPAAPRNRRPRGDRHHSVSDWLRDWLVTSWARWKQLAEAIDFV
jgi:hypothetical protein